MPHLQWWKIFIVVASYVFYGTWSTGYLLLLILATAVNWALGLLLAPDADGRRRIRILDHVVDRHRRVPAPVAERLLRRRTELLDLLADTSWVWSQYDHQLFLNTVEAPGGDAAVLRLKHPSTGAETGRGLALTEAGAARLVSTVCPRFRDEMGAQNTLKAFELDLQEKGRAILETVEAEGLLVVHPSVPAKNVKELLASGKPLLLAGFGQYLICATLGVLLFPLLGYGLKGNSADGLYLVDADKAEATARREAGPRRPGAG